MKKTLLVLMALILALAMVACTTEAPVENPDAPVEGTDTPAEGTDSPAEGTDAPAEGTEGAAKLDGDLKEILAKIVEGATPEELMVDTIEINAELFPGFFPVEAPANFEAYVCAPLIGSIAHEVSVLRVGEGADVEALAKDIEANLDPRKWICVEAEKTAVVVRDNVILVVMSAADVVDTIVDNFNAL